MGKAEIWTIQTRRERPELTSVFYEQKLRIWPEFMLHDRISNKYWGPYVNEIYDDFQQYLVDEAGRPIAVAHAIPLTWDGTQAGLPIGWNECFVRAAADYKAERKPDTLAALEISIQPEYHGQGISYRMINALRNLAVRREFKAVIVAVRPSWKMRYPLTPMERYVRWQQEDGAPFDPWLRAHWRSGGEILKVAHPSMIIEESVDVWEKWAGEKFPESGDYILADALVPIQIDREMNIGRYVEPNVWVHHPITTERLGKDLPVFER
jgi:GNAT superfamily N-acetyltransferase